MNKIIFSILFCLCFFSFYAQQVECSKFENGSFIYPKLEGKKSVRKGSVQKSYTDGKLEMIWKVKWLSECKYELICKKVINKEYLFQKGDKISCTIIETEGNCLYIANIFYNSINPNGVEVPTAYMCIESETVKE